MADQIAVASYTFRWYARNMEEEILSKRFDKSVRDGRATQVFVLTPEGTLHIVSVQFSPIEGGPELALFQLWDF